MLVLFVIEIFRDDKTNACSYERDAIICFISCQSSA